MSSSVSSNRTVFMLGVAGLSLAIAMFFDGAKPSPQVKPPPQLEKQEADVKPPPQLEQQADVKPPPQPELKPVSVTETSSYKDIYLAGKKRELDLEIAALPDYSYKGDGSYWDKKHYFIMEAYRRSRENTPIDPSLIAEAQILNAAIKEEEDEDEDEDEQDDEEDDITSGMSTYEREQWDQAKSVRQDKPH